MRRVVVVGGMGGTNVGESLWRAGRALGFDVELIDHARAYTGPALIQRVIWRAARRPIGLRRFAKQAVDRVFKSRTSVLITTGAAPLPRSSLDKLRENGVFCINFSTDDPWNSAHRAAWFLDALRAYNLILTPRRSNITDFRRLGCADVRYLPFGYDDELFSSLEQTSVGESSGEVLFVGGGDDDRALFLRTFRSTGCPLTLIGSYWDRYRDLAALSRGQLGPELLREATGKAAVNLCLVRRANRDGHVMRSLEIPAVGGFMLAEDTEDHREFFGAEGECVLYFQSPLEAAEKARWALANVAERRRMSQACRKRLIGGGHTYRDRLRVMLDIACH